MAKHVLSDVAKVKVGESVPVPKKRGRPAKERTVPEFIKALGTNAQVIPVELTQIDQADKAYQFRVALRVGDLVESIQTNGQQMPAILRKAEGKDKLQIVSGFRRITAIGKIGWPSVNAIVLDGVSDEEAWKISVLENEARKTYSDLDRAYAIVAYRKMGHTIEDIGKTVFKLSRKQATRLNSLVTLPKEVQEALVESRITTTHALVLKQLHDKLGDLDYLGWIGRIEDEDLSVGQLRSAVVAERKDQSKDEVPTLFVRTSNKKTGTQVIRFRPVKLDIAELSTNQRNALVTELEELLAQLRH